MCFSYNGFHSERYRTGRLPPKNYRGFFQMNSLPKVTVYRPKVAAPIVYRPNVTRLVTYRQNITAGAPVLLMYTGIG